MVDPDQTVVFGRNEVDDGSAADPGVARAGRAVAARRQELEITQRTLARDHGVHAGTLIALEKGRSWPRRATLAKLEEALDWPADTIARIRSGVAPDAAAAGTGVTAPSPSYATTATTETVGAPLMAETVTLAMQAITAEVDRLPTADGPDFAPRVAAVLANLRRLEKVAAKAGGDSAAAPSVVLALSEVRRAYHRLMITAADAPSATLGQRLYAARDRARLGLAEAAAVCGLPVEELADVEAERPAPPGAAAAIEALIGRLTG